MKVEDVMILMGSFPAVEQKTILKEALTEMGEANLGLVCIINEKQELLGLITDGDLRRQLKKNIQIDKVELSTVIAKKFKTVKSSDLVVEAAKMMKKFKVYTLVVEENKDIVGILSMHDILEANVL